MTRAGGDPGAVDEHRRDVMQVIPRDGEVAAPCGPGHDPAHRGRRHAVAGLGEKLCRRPCVGQFGRELRCTAGETGRHAASCIDAEELEQRRDPPTASTAHLRERQLHPPQAREQHPAPRATAASPEPSLAAARWASEGSRAATVKRCSTSATHVVEHRLLVGLQQPGPDPGTQLTLRDHRRPLEPDDVGAF